MRKVLLTFSILLISVLVACSNGENNESTGDSGKQKGNGKAYTSGDVVDSPISLALGEPITITIPEKLNPERKYKATVYAVDYIKDIDVDTRNDDYDYIVIDWEVENIGNEKLSMVAYPRFYIHTTNGAEDSLSIDFKEMTTFEKPNLIPGGKVRGISTLKIDEGTEIASLLMEPDLIRMEGQRPIKIETDISAANDSPSALSEEIKELRNAYYAEEFSGHDNEILTGSQVSAIRLKINNYGLIMDPEKSDDFPVYDKEYLSEFIYDEDGNFQGLKFTEQ